MLEQGDALPEFEVQNHEDQKVKSSNIEDAIIYFYPKAGTPGCTKEACNFRDSIKQLEKAGMKVYGVSTDSVKAQKKFHDNQDLNFELLADEQKELTEGFGVKSRLGVSKRVTFVIRDGKIEKVFEDVNPSNHIEEVVEYVKT
jgi:peroxiredoxin Q/BCP